MPLFLRCRYVSPSILSKPRVHSANRSSRWRLMPQLPQLPAWLVQPARPQSRVLRQMTRTMTKARKLPSATTGSPQS
jgi:hypothetical protein